MSWILVALSLLGNVGVVYARRWGWGLWIVANAGWVLHHGLHADWASVSLFSAYFGLAVWGYVKCKPASVLTTEDAE